MKLLALAPVAIFAVLGGLFYTGMRQDETAGLPSAYVGRTAPALTVIAFQEGPLVTTEMLQAPGVKVVNFWASWCAPCRVEHPNLMALQKAGVTVYGINYKDDPAQAQRFLTGLGNPFSAIAADPAGRTGLDWGLYGVPETFIIDGKGNVVLRFAGPLTNEVMQSRILPGIAKAGTN